ncbi:MAG: T9SS type A sorting domain-containing protein [Saprospiraceae bacterium]
MAYGQSYSIPPLCHQEGVLPDPLPAGVYAGKPAAAPDLFVNVYIHNCVHPDGSGGLTPQQIADIMQTTANDFVAYDIIIRAELCEDVIVDDPNDPYFLSTDQHSFGDIADKYGCNSNGIDVFILPNDFRDNAGGFGSGGSGGGNAVSIPSRTLFLFGEIDCTFPSLYQYQGILPSPQGVGPHAASVPHHLSHELGHCFGLGHPHDDSAFYGNVPNLLFCVNETCNLVLTEVPYPCFFAQPIGQPVTLDPQDFPFFGNPTYQDNIMAYTNFYDCQPVFTSPQGDRMYDYLLNHPILTNIAHDEINGDVVINTPTIWTAADFFPDGKVTVNGTITIQAGGTLTIESGVRARFPEGEGIVVEQGGVLNLFGYLGPACCTPWEGVRVLGTPNVVPGPATHGRFFGSGGVIEYAKTGVMSLSGGCIGTDNGMTFNNNGTGVFFGIFSQHGGSYDLLYISSLRNTNFNTTDYKRAVESPLGWNMKCHVLVSSYQGSNELLSINQCNFQNTVWNERRTRCGILTFDSEQYISYNKFSNFESAIYSFNLFGSLSAITPSYIKFNQFERNNISVYNRRMPLSIGGNTFDLSNIYLLTSDLPNSGLIVADPYAYFGVFATGNTETLDISANNFFNIPPSPPLPFPLRTTTGVYVQGIGSSSDIFEWYNGFSGLSYGNIAEGINSGWETVNGLPQLPPITLPTGFHYLCNTNTDNELHDFAVATGGSVRYFQADMLNQFPFTANPAKNTFSYFDLVANQSDFLNLGLPIRYYYQPSSANQEPLDYSVNAIDKIPVFGEVVPCLQRIIGDTIMELINEGQMLQFKNEYHMAKAKMDTVALQFIEVSASADTAAMNSLNIFALAYRTQMDRAIYGILGYYSMQGGPKDSLRLWTSRFGRIESEYRIARDYIHENNASAADSILELVPLKFALSTSRLAELAALRNMLPLLAGKNVYQLDSVTLQALAIYDDTTLGYTADLAQSIQMGNGIFAPIRFVLPQGEGAGQRSSEHAGQGMDGNNDPQSGFSFYPNPTNNILTVKYPAAKVDLHLEIYDLLGRLQQVELVPAYTESRLVNTSVWKEGLYFIRVFNDDKQLTATRILIKH